MSNFPSVERLLPHRATMLRLDGLTMCSDKEVKGYFVVKEGDPFVRHGYLREEAIVETLAQTVAAGQGLPVYEGGGETSLGYLTGVENFTYHRRVVLGDKIDTVVSLIAATGPLRVMGCRAFCGEECVASGMLKFYTEPSK
jgi:predicted hotdog family 3-hydroxylacyl-ACP dehydratase